MNLLKYFTRKIQETNSPETSDDLKQTLEERRRLQRDLTDYRGALYEMRNPSSQYNLVRRVG